MNRENNDMAYTIGNGEIEADQCSPAGWSDPQRSQTYRLRYFRNHPRGLEGNP